MRTAIYYIRGGGIQPFGRALLDPCAGMSDRERKSKSWSIHIAKKVPNPRSIKRRKNRLNDGSESCPSSHGRGLYF